MGRRAGAALHGAQGAQSARPRHAPKTLHDEIKADFNDLVHAKSAAEVVAKRKAFLAKWRLRCRPVATSLEEAGERLFTFLRYPPEQWRSLRTTDEIDKRFVAAGAMISAHGRPRGKERGRGWEPRRAA